MKQNAKADVAPAECGQHTHGSWIFEETDDNAVAEMPQAYDISNGITLIATVYCTSNSEHHDKAKGNAAFIVRACNAHDQLVEALTDIAGMAETGRESVNECITAIRQIDVDAAAAVTRGCFLSIVNKARAALAQAQKGAQ